MRDLLHDEAVGFQVFTTDDIEEMGPEGMAKKLKKRLGNGPVYLSFDIDTIDPSMAPASESCRARKTSIKAILPCPDQLLAWH